GTRDAQAYSPGTGRPAREEPHGSLRDLCFPSECAHPSPGTLAQPRALSRVLVAAASASASATDAPQSSEFYNLALLRCYRKQNAATTPAITSVSAVPSSLVNQQAGAKSIFMLVGHGRCAHVR